MIYLKSSDGNHITALALLATIVVLSAIAIAVYQHPTPATKLKNWWQLSLIDLVTPILIAAITIFIASSDLTSWYFSSVGDEGAFFSMARALLAEPSLSIFSYSGVYSKFPVADSYYQATVLYVFGESVWAWKFSCALVHGGTVIVIYALGNLLHGRLLAIAGATLLGLSHYFLAFDHIGYNNTNMCFLGSLTILAFANAYSRQSLSWFFVTGSFCGLLTYSIWGGLITFPVVLIALFLSTHPGQGGKFMLKGAMLIGIGFALVAIPGLIVNRIEDITRVAIGLNHDQNPLLNDSVDTWQALLRSTLVFLVNNRWWGSHYVHGPFIDSVTGLMACIGLAVLIRRWQFWQSKLLLSWVSMGLITIVLASNSSDPYPTRLLYLLPALCLIAGFGIINITNLIHSRQLVAATVSVCLALSAMLNLQQLYVGTPLTYPLYKARIAVKEMLNSNRQTVVFISEGENVDHPLRTLLEWYSPSNIKTAVFSEREIELGFANGTLPTIILGDTKIIATNRTRTTIKKLVEGGVISGPIATIIAQPYGDDMITAGDCSFQGTNVRHPHAPKLLRDLLGMS